MTARRRTLAASTWLAWGFGVTELLVEADGSAAATTIERNVDELATERIPSLPELAQALLAAAPLAELPRFALVGEPSDAPGTTRAIVRGALAVRGDSAPDAPGRVDGAGAVIVAEGRVRGRLDVEIARSDGETFVAPLREGVGYLSARARVGEPARSKTGARCDVPGPAGAAKPTQEYTELTRGSRGSSGTSARREAGRGNDLDEDTLRGGPVQRLRAEHAAGRPSVSPRPSSSPAQSPGPAQSPAPAQSPSAQPSPSARPSPQPPPPAGSPTAAARAGDGLVIDFGPSGRVETTGPVIIGRAPSAAAARGGDTTPQLVTIEGGNDISRSHVRVEVSGGVTIVTDLHSRNGTEVLMPGRARQRLRAGEPTAVMPGTVVDLGRGITFSLRRSVGAAFEAKGGRA